MEATRTTETLIATYKTARRHNPEDHNQYKSTRLIFKLKMAVFWFIAPGSLIGVYRRFS
jgi:hypothetical protein